MRWDKIVQYKCLERKEEEKEESKRGCLVDNLDVTAVTPNRRAAVGGCCAISSVIRPCRVGAGEVYKRTPMLEYSQRTNGDEERTVVMAENSVKGTGVVQAIVQGVDVDEVVAIVKRPGIDVLSSG